MATVGVPITVQGIAVNPETQQAVLVNPSSSGLVSFFSLIDQSVSSLALEKNNGTDAGTNAAAYNPLTNTVVAVNFTTNEVSVIDPTTPRRLNDNNLFQLSCPAEPPMAACGPVAIAIDPGTNVAVIANQTDNSISVLNMGAIQTFSITETSPKTFISNSSLGTSPEAPHRNRLR